MSNKKALLKALLKKQGEKDIRPLSYTQQQFWFSAQMDATNAVDHISVNWRMRGEVDANIVEKCFRTIVSRHSMLRTTFQERDGQVFQVTHPHATASINQIDVDQEQQAYEYVQTEAHRLFDLENGPLFRVSIVTVDYGDVFVLVNMHHIIADGWSTEVLQTEFTHLYQAFSTGESPALQPLSLQYTDFALWQKNKCQRGDFVEQLTYWQQQLADVPVLQLPTDHPRPPVQTYNGRTKKFPLPKKLVQDLEELSRQEGTTLYMTLLTAFYVLLSRYSGQQDIAVGTAVAGRNREELEEIVGPFVNMVVLRANLSLDMKFRALLQHVKEVTLAALAHQELPFEQVVQALQPERNAQHTPLFQAAFALENKANVITAVDVDVEMIDVNWKTSLFDLSFMMEDHGDHLVTSIVYNTDLFSEETIARMGAQFQILLEAMVTNPSGTIEKLPLMSERERTQLLVDWNNTAYPYPAAQTVPALFEEQAAKTPEAVALVTSGGNEVMTYGQLNTYANRIARFLVQQGVQPGDFVGVCMQRSFEQMASIIAILKAGGAYIGLDPTYPSERLNYMITESEMSLLFVDRHVDVDVFVSSVDTVVLEQVSLPAEATNLTGQTRAATNIANVIYTSGSTGTPKGVLIPHRGIVRLVKGKTWVPITPEDVYLQGASIAFDAATFEIWSSLLNGAKLVLLQAARPSVQDYADVIQAHQVSTLWLTAGLFNAIVDEQVEALRGVKYLLAGGEALSVPHVKKAMDVLTDTQIINGYGPAENTACTTCHWIEAADLDRVSIPIGRPIANTNVYVLDQQGQPVPIGVVGELYTGGDGLAAGYLKRPELTKERFIPHPFKQRAAEKLYRTGDLVRYLPDGSLSFVGRADHQVKIRGFRIELDEVSAVLGQHSHVQAATCHVYEDRARGKQLIAYVVPANDATFQETTLRAHLTKTLPAFMVPTQIIMLAALPLSANGKVDRKALPAPTWEADENSSDNGPLSPIEEILAAIWTEVLGVKRVRRNDHFFACGGHSLLATQVVSRIRKQLAVNVPVSQLFQTPVFAELAHEVDQAIGMTGDKKPLTRRPREERLPLSFSQTRMWFFEQMYPGNHHYHMPLSWRIRGSLQVTVLEESFAALIARHESLRTTFVKHGEEAVQCITPPSFSLPVIDVSAETDKEAHVRALIQAERERSFSFTAGPLFRVKLFKLATDEYELFVNMHHIISDGWSIGVLIRELRALYEAFLTGKPSPLPPLPVQYADFAIWQRDWLASGVATAQMDYWREKLTGVDVLQLPTDYPRPATQTFAGKTHKFQIDTDMVAALRKVSEQAGATLYMTLLAAFNILLQRYSGQEDITVGTPVAGRNETEVENVIGFFVNTLVIRSEVAGSASFLELLNQVKETALHAYAHQDVPFDQLVSELDAARDPSYSPLFQVLFALQNMQVDTLTLPDVSTETVAQAEQTALFDLSLMMTETADGLVGELIYNIDLFTEERIAFMTEHFRVLLAGIVHDPTETVAALPLISAKEQQLLTSWQQPPLTSQPDNCVHTLFEAQVARTPDALALINGGQSLTYAELNARANVIARILLDEGIAPGDPIGICMDRSFAQIASMIAILKVGGAYVCLDPAYPQERLQYIADETVMPMLLVDQAEHKKFTNVHTICLSECNADHTTNLTGRSQPLTTVANIIYTSGSTGTPKGVRVTHAGIVRLVNDDTYVPVSADDVYLYASSMSFDAATFEIWRSLLNGARLVLMPTERPSLQDYEQVIQTKKVSVLWLTAGLFNVLVDDHVESLRGVKYLLVGGEALSTSHVKKAIESLPDTKFINGYGPTENTVFTTCHRITTEDLNRPAIPIGRPIVGTEVYVLDERQQLVPTGVVGELYTGGAGLAAGYLNQPTLTEERFIPHPLKAGTEEKLYRTGDLVRYLPDGTLMFVGRQDHQVKIRGFRIELGEVESVFVKHAHVQAAVIDVYERAETGKQLIAYVVPEDTLETSLQVDALRDDVKQTLPPFMVPSAIVVLEALPLSVNGKVDRKALPAPDWEACDDADRDVTARTETEQVLMDIWKEVLGVTQVARADDFFARGGHSLLATQVVSRVRKLLAIDFPLVDLFRVPVLSDMAREIEKQRDVTCIDQPIVPASRKQPLQLSFSQQRMWFFEQMHGENCHYQIPSLWQLRGPIDVAALEKSFYALIERHESLRTCFVGEADAKTVRQNIQPAAFTLNMIDVSDEPNAAQAAKMLVHEDMKRPFHFETGPLFRASLIKLGTNDYQLLVNMHHIISDGWSLGILMRELSRLYAAFVAGTPSPLPMLPVQYADFAVWQRKWLQDDMLTKHMDYWKQQLSGTAVLQLPTDYVRPATQTFTGKSKRFQLSAACTASLRTFSHQMGTTLYMTLLAAFKVMLHRYSGQADIAVGTPVAGRERTEVENVIGFFVNTLVMRTQVEPSLSFADVLQRVKDTTLAAYAHQAVPFDLLVSELEIERNPSYTPLFQVLFTLQNTPLETLQLSGVDLRALPLEQETALFDLLLSMEESGDELTGAFIYNTTLFSDSRINDMTDHFQVLLETVVTNETAPIDTIEMMSADMRHRLLNVWSKHAQTDFTDTVEKTFVHELFAKQAAATPHAIALVSESEEITYAALHAQANGIAKVLKQHGVKAGDMIGICMNRSGKQIASMIAVLKVGGAYVGLDPSYPQERLQYMVDDTEMPLLLTTSAVMEKTTLQNAQMVCVDQLVLQADTSNVTTESLPEAPLANIIYTSGSTGAPKGVRITHDGIVRLAGDDTCVPISVDDVYLYASSMSFDAATFEIWRSLLNGARLVLMSTERPSLQDYERVIQTEKVSVLWLTAGLFNVLVDDHVEALRGVKYLLVGGEALSTPHVKKAMQMLPDTTFINGYGPTENTVFTTCHQITAEDLARPAIPIGRPIAGTEVYVLDERQKPVPIGIVGELYTGGAGLAAGYLNQPSLTAEQFIPHPLKENTAEKLYRTGDLVRYLPDGTLTFVGRRDHQVKIRGFRIELGEVTCALLAYPQIQTAIAHVQEDSDRGKQLVAYVVPENGQTLNVATLRDDLKEKLPAFMVPTAFVILEALPLSANGKVDRQALPQPDWEAPNSVQDGTALQTPVEEMLADIWSDVLGVTHVTKNDHFFDRGGHSLLATQVTSRVRKVLGVDFPLSQLFQAPRLADMAREIQARMGMEIVEKTLVSTPREQSLPLSFAQQRLWFFEQMYHGSCHYHMPSLWRFTGALNISVLEQCLTEMVRRHESLRTCFAAENGDAVQQIQEPMPFPLPVTDVGDVQDTEQAVQTIIERERARLFDLTTGPLVRATLIKIGPEEHQLLVMMHHIISDGWSMDIFMRELQVLYSAFVARKPSPLAPLPVQYADFAVWQRDWLQGEVLDAQLAYWHQQLNGVTPLQLPTDYPRPAVQTLVGKTVTFTIPQTVTDGLKNLSRQTGATLYMTLLSAFYVLLQRYSGQEDLTIGTPIANRNDADIEGLVGFFVNTLVLRAQVPSEARFQELLQQVKDTTLAAYAHQDVPFEKLVETLCTNRDTSFTPLFQVLFALQNVPETTTPFTDIQVEQLPLENETALFDLSLIMTEREAKLTGGFVYNTALFTEERVTRMIAHFQELLQAIVTNSEETVGALSLISAQEEHQLLVEWNDTTYPYPRDRTVHELFEEQVAKTPDAIALESSEGTIDYAALNARANEIARHLLIQGLEPGDCVGLCMNRSFDQIASAIAVLKAGGAYVGLDPEYPLERLQFIVNETAMPLLLTDHHHGLQHVFANTQVICLDELTLPVENANVSVVQEATTLANVIYTSGSTGKPKGVAVAHRGIVRLVKGKTWVPISENDACLYASSISFDASTMDIWSSLLNGARLVVMTTTNAGLQDYADVIQKHQINIVWLTAGLFNVIVDHHVHALKGVKYLLVGGEALSVPHIQKALDTLEGTQIINGYGPSENTVCTTCHWIEADDVMRPSIPIGCPIANTNVYVLDQRGQLAPIGVVGELYIGGDGVARGYLNRPDLTRERFIPHPFKQGSGETLYRTGDLVRYLPDGQLLFVGRADDQVKIRGFRIELGEIEAMLRQHHAIDGAIVTAGKGAAGDKTLTAYVVTKQDLDTKSVRAYTKERLPHYMIPAHICILEAFPLTENGKVDRKALIALQIEETTETVLPTSERERQLVAIWQRVLQREHIGIRDNFFELGGHSLLATKLMFMVGEELGVNLSLRHLFENPTIEGMAQVLEEPANCATQDIFRRERFKKDCVLDRDITSSFKTATQASTDVQAILLTGATGFLGSYMLRDLLVETDAMIYCLIREKDGTTPLERLKKSLQRYHLWQASFAARIKPVCGDLAQPRLGLTDDEWAYLEETIDVIYQNGAEVNFMMPYEQSKYPNVYGTKEIIRMAARHKIKPIHYVSTLSVFTEPAENEPTVLTEASDLGSPANLQIGYTQSKWVAEQVVAHARAQGLPISIYRPGRISGDSVTGIVNESDFLWRLVRGCIELGLAPRMEAEIEMTPVDKISQSIICLSQKEAIGGVYHLFNNKKTTFATLVQAIKKYHDHFAEVSLDEWLQALEEDARLKGTNPMAPLIHLLKEGGFSEARTAFCNDKTMSCLHEHGVSYPAITSDMVAKTISHFYQTGVLKSKATL